jgi:hypothetical protein
MLKIYNFLVDNNYVYKRNVSEESVSLKTNYVPYMYINPPKKSDVLAYKKGTGPYPGR